MSVNLLALSARLHLCFGRYSGHITAADATRIELKNLVGWAEEMRARW